MSALEKDGSARQEATGHGDDPRGSAAGAEVVVIGEALIDAVQRLGSDEVTEYVGGSPANVAIGLSRLEHDVALLTALGHDSRGDMIRKTLAKNAVRYLPGTSQEITTSVAQATIGSDGSAHYDFHLAWQIDAPAAAAKHVHTGSIGAALDPALGTGGADVRRVIRTMSSYATVSYDPNVRADLMGSPQEAKAAIEEVVAVADCVKASDEDIAWCYPTLDVAEVAQRWLERGVGVVVITRGAQGAVAYNRQGSLELEAEKAQVVDTIGAGDSFMAGLVSGLLDVGLLGDVSRRLELRNAELAVLEPVLRRALRCASITVSREGAQPPTRAEVREAFSEK